MSPKLNARYRDGFEHNQAVICIPFLDEVWYTDTVHSRILSYSSCLYDQIFTNRTMDFVYVVPLRNNKAPAMLYALQKFVAEVGRPRVLKSDRAPETLGDHTPFNEFCRKFHILRKYWETGRHEGNQAESAIRELKRRWKFDMYRKQVPHRF